MQTTIQPPKQNEPIQITGSPYFVYLMLSRLRSDQMQKAKIGISKHPLLRMSKIEHASGHRLNIHHLIPCESKGQALAVEKSLHNIFAQQKAKGEWFWLASKDIGFVSEIKSALNMLEIWEKWSNYFLRGRFGDAA